MENRKKPKKTVDDSQLDLFEVKGKRDIYSENQEQYEDESTREKQEVTHFNNPDDLLEFEKEDPEGYKALKKVMDEAMEKDQEQKEVDVLEESALAREEASKPEEEKIKELRESITKIIKDNEINEVIDERDDKTGQYRHTEEIARQIRDEESIKKEELKVNKNKPKFKIKKGSWRINWNSIKNRYNSK